MTKPFLSFALLMLLPAQAFSDEVFFGCHIGGGSKAEPHLTGENSVALVAFRLNTSTQSVTTNGQHNYTVIAVTNEALWLRKLGMSESAIDLTTISRSPEGGPLTSTVLNSDGTLSTVSYGYCTESTS